MPDKALARWKPTNPKCYISKFEQYAAMRPRFYLAETSFAEARADIASLPEQVMTKPFLNRIVQLLKRHRDHMFVGIDRSALAPISVIITTLAAWSYAHCAKQQVYTDAFDFITAVIRNMPSFIRIESRTNGQFFIIENETTAGENFADKWNGNARLASSFYAWHKDVLESIESLLLVEGVDKFAESLSYKFGAKKEQIHDTLAGISNRIDQARSAGSLVVVPTLGITTSSSIGSVSVPRNTFFGR